MSNAREAFDGLVVPKMAALGLRPAKDAVDSAPGEYARAFTDGDFRASPTGRQEIAIVVCASEDELRLQDLELLAQARTKIAAITYRNNNDLSG